MKEASVGNRLLCCAELVRQGAVLADVGTDHGYLPVHLLRSGKISRAICSDINSGPLARAMENVSEAGLTSFVDFVRADGAKDLAEYGATDYAVCGMGGELIARIIDTAPHLKSGEVRLILQPMSRPEALRASLWESGFSILDEKYSEDDGKLYVCFLASYTGEKQDFTPAEAYFGKPRFIDENSAPCTAYVRARIAALKRANEGKIKGGNLNSEEAKILREIEKNSVFANLS